MTSASSIKQHIIEHEILGITAGGGGGSITIIDGFPTYVDTTRGGKTLSINRLTLTAAKAGRANNIYLRTSDSLATSKTGFRMMKNGTITGISLQLSSSATCEIEVLKNDLDTPLTSLSLTAAQGGHSSSVNVDFSESDKLQFFISGVCYDPIVVLEVAWRF